MDLDAIFEFFKEQKYAVVSTLSGSGSPQAALVGISRYPDFKMVLGTQAKTRKFQNIQQHDRVAVVVGLGQSHQTIQLEGQARILEGEERQHYMEEHFLQQPWSRSYADDPGQNYILIEPTWLRYTDIDQKPELIVEHQLAG